MLKFLGERGKTRHLVVLATLLALCAAASGCVRRRMTIRTNPPGALAYVDDYELGTTPVSTDFTYYGTRKIRLVKDGYETLTVMQPVRPPWYQIPPLDFITENLIPGELRDQRDFYYRLQPQVIVPTDRLLSRAEQLRRGVVPVGGSLPAGQMPPGMSTGPAGGSAGSAPAGTPATSGVSGAAPSGPTWPRPFPPAGPMQPAVPAQPAPQR